jgi:hypothetical protein
MTSKIYGTSDDLIEFRGDVDGEAGHFGTDESPHGVLVIFSDGNPGALMLAGLEFHYPKFARSYLRKLYKINLNKRRNR